MADDNRPLLGGYHAVCGDDSHSGRAPDGVPIDGTPFGAKRLGKHERELLLLAAPSDTDFAGWTLFPWGFIGANAQHNAAPAPCAFHPLPPVSPRRPPLKPLWSQLDPACSGGCSRRLHLTRTPLGDMIVAALGDTLKSNTRI